MIKAEVASEEQTSVSTCFLGCLRMLPLHDVAFDYSLLNLTTNCIESQVTDNGSKYL